MEVCSTITRMSRRQMSVARCDGVQQRTKSGRRTLESISGIDFVTHHVRVWPVSVELLGGIVESGTLTALARLTNHSGSSASRREGHGLPTVSPRDVRSQWNCGPSRCDNFLLKQSSEHITPYLQRPLPTSSPTQTHPKQHHSPPTSVSLPPPS